MHPWICGSHILTHGCYSFLGRWEENDEVEVFAAYQDLPPCRAPLKHIAHRGNSSPCNRADITTLYKRIQNRAGGAILALRSKQKARERKVVMKSALCLPLVTSSGPQFGTVCSSSTHRLSPPNIWHFQQKRT